MEARKIDQTSEQVRARLVNTPLHLAVFNNDIAMVESLLASGVSVDVKNNDGQTAFELACELGRYDCAEKFESILKYFVDTSGGKYGRLFLYAVSCESRLELAQNLYGAGASTAAVLRDNRYTALHHAAANSNQGGVKFLLSIGASLSAKNYVSTTPIAAAAKNNAWSTIKIMVESIDKDKMTEDELRELGLEEALDKAIYAEEISVIELLLQHGASCNERNYAGFNRALFKVLYDDRNRMARNEIMITLLRHGADPDMCNKHGDNLRQVAISCGNKSAADILWQYMSGSSPEVVAGFVTEIEQMFQGTLSPDLHTSQVLFRLFIYFFMIHDLMQVDIKALTAKRNRLNLDREKHQQEVEVLDRQIHTLQQLRTYPDKPVKIDSDFAKTTVGIHVADHLKHLESIQNFYARVNTYLVELRQTIDTTEWKVKSFLDVFTNKWHTGTPRHINLIKNELNKLSPESTLLETLGVYYVVTRILDEVPHHGCRHPDTAAFYQRENQKIKHLRFMPKPEAVEAATTSLANSNR